MLILGRSGPHVSSWCASLYAQANAWRISDVGKQNHPATSRDCSHSYNTLVYCALNLSESHRLYYRRVFNRRQFTPSKRRWPTYAFRKESTKCKRDTYAFQRSVFLIPQFDIKPSNETLRKPNWFGSNGNEQIHIRTRDRFTNIINRGRNLKLCAWMTNFSSRVPIGHLAGIILRKVYAADVIVFSVMNEHRRQKHKAGTQERSWLLSFISALHPVIMFVTY